MTVAQVIEEQISKSHSVHGSFFSKNHTNFLIEERICKTQSTFGWLKMDERALEIIDASIFFVNYY